MCSPMSRQEPLYGPPRRRCGRNSRRPGSGPQGDAFAQVHVLACRRREGGVPLGPRGAAGPIPAPTGWSGCWCGVARRLGGGSGLPARVGAKCAEFGHPRAASGRPVGPTRGAGTWRLARRPQGRFRPGRFHSLPGCHRVGAPLRGDRRDRHLGVSRDRAPGGGRHARRCVCELGRREPGCPTHDRPGAERVRHAASRPWERDRTVDERQPELGLSTVERR